jgi:hypothetical protein
MMEDPKQNRKTKTLQNNPPKEEGRQNKNTELKEETLWDTRANGTRECLQTLETGLNDPPSEKEMGTQRERDTERERERERRVFQRDKNTVRENRQQKVEKEVEQKKNKQKPEKNDEEREKASKEASTQKRKRRNEEK